MTKKITSLESGYESPPTVSLGSGNLDGLTNLLGDYDNSQYLALNEEMTFEQYISNVLENPALIRSAFQRMYDMIISFGSNEFERYRKKIIHYNFFDDSEYPVFGLDETLSDLVTFLRGAAGRYGTEKRVLLLHGPVGSSKSTICRRLKRGMERYSRTPEGAWYSYKWVDLPKEVYVHTTEESPMFEDPVLFLPEGPIRQNFLAKVNKKWAIINKEYDFVIDKNINPRSKKFLEHLLREYKGDLYKVLSNHVVVIRKVYNEVERVGIGTFQPKDEKNQDATELTGDINYGTLKFYGSDSDPRSFNFDGEFEIANRGMIEFIEMLKLDRAFLYDLLGVSQEHSIKPKKFSQLSVDEVIIGHTNLPDYDRLKNDTSMEALRDRTIRINVPYLLSVSDELKVYEKDYGQSKVKQHVAPHTLEIAAFFAILTRLQYDGELSLRDKAKLYDHKILPGYTEDRVKELRDKASDEGMKSGVSPRYVQDQISNTLSEHHDYINPFMVMNKLKDNLHGSSLITNVDDIQRYETCIDHAIKELNDILKKEVRKALVADEKAIVRLCANYIDNLMAFIGKKKIRNQITGKDEAPNEQLMRAIEEKIDIPHTGVDDFRASIAGFIAGLDEGRKSFQWNSNPDLEKALEAKLFDDIKDHVKLSTLSSSVIDDDQREKIDAIKDRLKTQYGYNEQSARDVLEYVSQLFNRGDIESDED